MRYSWGSIIDVSIERNKSIHLELPFRRDDLPRGLYISRSGFGYDVYIGPSVLDAQSFLTLCNPMDYSPPSSSVRGILQARIKEWVNIPFSRGSSWPRDRILVSCIAGGFFTIWTIALPSELWPTYIALLKSRDIALPTRVRLVRAMVFPVVMCGCES